MPSNPYLMDRGQNLAQMLMSLGAGFSMAGANNQPWWAGIGPAAAMYGQAQQQGEDRAYRQQQMDENNAYRKLQEQALQAQIDEKKAAREAATTYVPPGFGVAPPGAAPTGVGMGVTPPKPTIGPGGDVLAKSAAATGKMESSNNYGTVGPVSIVNGKEARPYGKYGVMDFNVGPWTKEVFGQEYTPEQFLKDEGAQDAVYKNKFGQYIQRYGSPEAASRAWFAGEGGMNNPNATDVLGTSVAGYEKKFINNFYGEGPHEAARSQQVNAPGYGGWNPNAAPSTAPNITMPVPPPSVPAPAPPPSPVVLTGGQGPVPVSPGAAPTNIPPPPQPPGVPQLSPEEAAFVRAQRMRPGMTDEKANALAHEILTRKAAAQAQQFQQNMKLYELQYGEAAKIQSEQRAIAAKIAEEQRAEQRRKEQQAEADKGEGSYEYDPATGQKRWISKADRAKGGVVVGDKPDKDSAAGTPTGDIRILETGDPASREYYNAHKRVQSRMIDGPDGMKYMPDMSGYRDPTFAADGARPANPDATGMVPVGGSKAIRQGEDELRKEFEGRQQIKAYREVVPIVESALEAVPRKTRAADLNLIYALGKVMDPNSVVREGEMVMARGTGTVQDYINGLLGQLNGAPTLQEETRKKLVAEINSRYAALKRSYDTDVEGITAIAERRGYNVKNIVTPVRPSKPEPTVIDLNGDK